MVTIEEVFNLPKNHKPERAVKSHLARNFYQDGNLFIERYDQVKFTDSMLKRNFRAKCIVDLAMSIECSLKSMIISLSKDSEKPSKAYKRARKNGHNIDGLYKEMALRAKSRFKAPKKIKKFLKILKP